MPDPRELRIGDRIRFISLPEEWEKPGYRVHEESVVFMRALIVRKRPARISSVSDDGYPWIEARLRRKDGTLEYHGWGIYESTGWRRILTRT